MNKINEALRFVSPENICFLQKRAADLRRQVEDMKKVEEALNHLRTWYGDLGLQRMSGFNDVDLLGIMEGLQQPTFAEFGTDKWRARMALEFLMSRGATSYEGSKV
jgi:hypothetical protein